MPHTRTRALLVSLAAMLQACGPTPTVEAPTCLKLSVPEGEVTTAPPAQVSLFFTVDTCDGQPVAGLTEEQFEIYEDGERVSEFESQRRIRPKGQKFRMYSLVLLDLSGSMLKSGGFPALRDAAMLYIDEVLAKNGDGQRVAIYSFDGRANLNPVVDFTGDPAALKAGIEKLGERQCSTHADCAVFSDRRTCAGWLCVDDSTNLNGAVVEGIDRLERELVAEPGIPFKESALVVFTDGTDQAARVSADTARARVQETRSHVFTIGLGGEIDERTLRDLGKDGFQPADQASELRSAFSQIASRVVSLASRFYLLEYCSPKRSGTHKLKVSATYSNERGLFAGSVSRSFDATGFTSGCALE